MGSYASLCLYPLSICASNRPSIQIQIFKVIHAFTRVMRLRCIVERRGCQHPWNPWISCRSLKSPWILKIILGILEFFILCDTSHANLSNWCCYTAFPHRFCQVSTSLKIMKYSLKYPWIMFKFYHQNRIYRYLTCCAIFSFCSGSARNRKSSMWIPCNSCITRLPYQHSFFYLLSPSLNQ